MSTASRAERAIHEVLVRRIFDEGIEIVSTDEHEGRFVVRLRDNDGNATYEPKKGRMEVFRQRAGARVYPSDRDALARLDAFIGGVEDVTRETVILAHEFGHARRFFAIVESERLAHDDVLEDIERRAGLGKIGPLEGNALYDEERGAWAEARAVLHEIDFSAWPVFDGIMASRLATYEQGIRSACPGWEPR